MKEPWKINYPCGCQFNGLDFPDPPEHCPAHGRPKTLFGLPIVEIDGCPSCADLCARVAKVEGALCRAIEVIGFYGDPETYMGIAVFADPPCGDFSKDYSHIGDDDRARPGKKARDFLFGMEAEFPDTDGEKCPSSVRGHSDGTKDDGK